MKKFKKLNRKEMKAMSGGLPSCPDGSFTKCDCGFGTECISGGGCLHPADICTAYCGGTPLFAAGCFTDDSCIDGSGNC